MGGQSIVTMNHSRPLQNRSGRFQFGRLQRVLLAAISIAAVGAPTGSGLAQDSFVDETGAQVLTRGPVHEAFAGVISYEYEPGIVVTSAPPELIEEIPPGERPVGDDVTWIPGYWAWDDERNDFLWISGIWRALPPGREWIVGYWADTTEGYQWTSGYWADVTTTEVTYLPAPPRSVEEGPNIEAPSTSHGWTPGCWIWSQERYAWSPGYWAEGRSDWDWIPAHYVWTRRGYVFVDDYWDHSVQRRGVLFAPVYFDRAVYSRPSYSYSPTIAIDLAMFAAHLFLRPRYDHYYFGDYYAPRYSESGFYSSHSYQSSRRGYDPVFAHQRWEHRDDRDWERGIERDYQFRRDDERARPPHTWSAQRMMDGGNADIRRNRSLLATSYEKMSRREDSVTRFQSVAQDDRQLLARRGQEVQKSREKRRAQENRDASDKREGGISKASRVPMERSPIAAKASNDRKGAGSPPEPQRGPNSDPRSKSKTDSKGQSELEPGRPTMGEKGKDKKSDDPQSPKGRPQPPTQRDPGKPSMGEKGKDKKSDDPQSPKGRPQPQTQRAPDGPSMSERGKGKKSDEPQEPKSKPQQSAPQRQPERPAKEEKGKSQRAAPQAPQTKPQPAPSPPKSESRPAKEKGKDKDDEDSKDKKKKK